MFHQVTDWLRLNPYKHLVIAVAYLLTSILPHKIFGEILNTTFRNFLTRVQYNQVVLSVSCLIFFSVLYYWIIIRRKEAGVKLDWLMLTFNIMLATLTVNYLFVINIEMVHFFQYGIWVLLLFPWTNSIFNAILISFLIGIGDETYQYICLTSLNQDYFDFNDVWINLLGSGFGGILFAKNTVEIVNSKTTFLVVGGVVVLVIVLFIFNVVGVGPDSGALVDLVKVEDDGFWRKIRRREFYHVLSPFEGTIACVMLLVLYGSWAKYRK